MSRLSGALGVTASFAGSSSDDESVFVEEPEDITEAAQETVVVTSVLRSRLSLQPLTIVVFGASGHLARTKTYPSLFELFEDNVFGSTVSFVGYARSKLEIAAFRKRIADNLPDTASPKLVKDFLNHCFYFSGAGYGDDKSINAFGKYLEELEGEKMTECKIGGGDLCVSNRLFYLATPPGVFTDCARGIQEHLSENEKDGGWVRVIVEKPFGKDSKSCSVLLSSMAAHLRESQVYRIDHYLAKEMVQNILVLRFGNTIWDTIWNRRSIRCVKISMKESAGVDGRGGYYDEFGVIRDVFQNHLMQVLALIAMEAPVSLRDDDIRDEKVKVLRAIHPPDQSRVVVGQYGRSHPDVKDGYLDDETVAEGSKQLTFIETVLFVNNSRWAGVPFVCKCGKGLDERSTIIRIQFKNDGLCLYPSASLNELVIRLQPKEAIWLKLNTKKPGYARFDKAYSNVLDLTYQDRFSGIKLPRAYARLILDALRGDQSLFVRDDELHEAWRIADPLLHEFEKPEFQPEVYQRGGRGPPESDRMAVAYGFTRAIRLDRTDETRLKRTVSATTIEMTDSKL